MTSARHTPLRILQGAGNTRDLLSFVAHEAVDGVSADVRVQNREVFAGVPDGLFGLGRLASRLLPARLSVARPGSAEPERITLDELLRAVDGRSRLLLRVHGAMEDPAPEIARVLYPLADCSHLLICAEDWALADRLLAWLPGLRIAYLVTTEGPLRRYVQGRLDGSQREVPLLVRDDLIHTPDEAQSLRGRAGALGAWAVGSPARALELAGWGIDVVVSESVEVLAALPVDPHRTAS